MPSHRRVLVLIVLPALVGVLAAWPGAASAALTINSANINGATSLSSPPGGVMEAKVNATANRGDSWRATQFRFGSDARCVDHGNGSATRTEQFDVTAPGTPGDYDAGFTARGANDCSGATSAEKVLADALRVTEPGANPELLPRCGINVMLVLDRSGSIASSGATEAVRNATRAFLTALSGTGAKVSIVDFSTSAKWQVDYTTVTAGTIAGVFEPYLTDVYRPSGWTNWEDAFDTVGEANTGATTADLVVFMTDGDPTARNTDSGGTVTGLVEGEAQALARAAQEADVVKSQGSHVFAMGVGEAVTNPTSARRLTAVSGFDQFSDPGVEFGNADYTLVQDFADLAQALRRIAVELCQASVTVTKVVDEGDGVYRPDEGWSFTASVSMSAGDYTWVQPAPPPASGPREQITNADGVATFQWRPDNAGASSTVSLGEEVDPGYDFVDADCVTSAPTRTRRRVVQRVRVTTPAAEVTVGPNQYARCLVRNRIRPGTIEIEKAANPETSQEFPFSGSLGDFILIDDGRDESTSARTFSGLAPGTYTVRELVPDNWELTGITCSDPAVTISGAEVVITLAADAAIVCTYSDTRIDPPPPEPPEPPAPPPTPPPEPPTPPAPPEPRTELQVVKTMPRVARVGRRVRFRLMVRNVGSVAARNVQMTDVPPAAVALASLRTEGPVRVVNGNAVWRFGTLAPGARRTVRGSVRLESGAPGRKRNLVFATAVNAKLVSDRADSRVRAAQQGRAPAVTG